MNKRERFNLINVLLAAVIMLSLFVGSIGVGNAWFIASHNKGIQIVMNLSGMNLSLYQRVGNSEVLLNTNQKNEDSETPSYVTLQNNEILPDVDNNLTLILENSDEGAGTYLRFKLQLIAQGVQYNEEQQKYVKKETVIPINLTLGAGIVESGEYYYYGTADGEGNLTDSTFFEKTEETPARLTLLTTFIVPFSSFQLLEGSETVKLVLSIEGSSVKF